MAEVATELDDLCAFCATDDSELSDIWSEIEAGLCHRDKYRSLRVLVDIQHMIFRHHGFELDVFIDHLSNGLWAEFIKRSGQIRMAIVIGTQQNVCVCGKLELLDALAELSDRTDNIHLASTTEQAVRWLVDTQDPRA